ncbi:lysylphosphatidylglycerol synthase domain-containing protein [Trinickia diaoshuihuensis]|uniref:lysylphosphatidylglycerol synthase domain-containing protein n=1 Tax=Trinickia diaoshuihuensis TaxID=2292265 RepID=UPI000E239D9E|nr:lysylphosphatidylglycerol synthase domain-containing protein [Trinickia diaoshuihuensis]
MTRTAALLLSLGAAVFVALLAWQGAGAVAAALATAGWGLALVAVFHVVPLIIDAAAIAVLIEGPASFFNALRARWVGESVNSLLPAGQIGGPVLMARHLAQRGLAMHDAAAAVTVSTTVQSVAQIAFALVGLVAFAAFAGERGAASVHALHLAALGASGVLAVAVGAFYYAQQRGLFGRFSRLLGKLFGPHGAMASAAGADAIDRAVRALYRRRGRIAATFALSLGGWFLGIGEVWLALRFIGHPVNWLDALLLESVGQAIRGAAFAIPGSLGAQEGGYLLLAHVVGITPDAALALSLAKRARELALGLPGLLYLQWSERDWRRRRTPGLPLAD